MVNGKLYFRIYYLQLTHYSILHISNLIIVEDHYGTVKKWILDNVLLSLRYNKAEMKNRGPAVKQIERVIAYILNLTSQLARIKFKKN